MSAKLMRKPSAAAKVRNLHEALALSAVAAIAGHGLMLLGDKFIGASLKDIVVPFAMHGQPFWTGIGIIGGWLTAIFTFSFYVRRWIGTKTWRKLHRFTLVAYALAVVHTIGSGTDAGTPWMIADRDQYPSLVRSDREGDLRIAQVTRRRRSDSRSSGASGPTVAAASWAGATAGRAIVSDGTVVVGGGLVAQRFCETLRKHGYEGRLTVVSEEQHPPYDRPPLSKQFLLGEVDHDDIAFRPRPWYDEQQVELALGECATGLDAAGEE